MPSRDSNIMVPPPHASRVAMEKDERLATCLGSFGSSNGIARKNVWAEWHARTNARARRQTTAARAGGAAVIFVAHLEQRSIPHAARQAQRSNSARAKHAPAS